MFTTSGDASGRLKGQPFVGREEELFLIHDLVSRSESGYGSVALVSGGAGIGKTSLVHAAEEYAREQGFLVLSGGANDLSATPPYGPWLELLAQYRPGEELPELPAFLSDYDALATLNTQERLHAEVLGFLGSVAAASPLLLVLEDLHWSDQASLELLRVIVRHCNQHRILVIATYRDDEVSRHHALYLLLPSLVREASPERIELRPLSEQDIEVLVNQWSSTGAETRSDVVTYLLQWAEGNPLFTVELLRTLQDQRDWRPEKLGTPTVPQLIRQMVDRRIVDLPEAVAAALQSAAVIGQVVPLRIWERVRSRDSIEQALVAGTASGLIIETHDGRGIGFRHALVREAIYDGIGLLGRRELHRRVANVLIEDPSIDPDSVAYHLQKADDERAPEWLIRAGEQAERRFAWPAAVERHHAAAKLLEHVQGSEPTLARLYLKLGRLLRFSDPGAGIQFLQRSRAAAQACGETAIAALALWNTGSQACMVGHPFTGLRQLQDGLEEILKTRDEASASSRWSQTIVNKRIDPVLSSIGTTVAQLSYAGRYREAIALVEQHLDIDVGDASDPSRRAEILNSTGSFADGYWGLGVSYTALGDLARGRHAFDLSRQALEEFNHLAHRLSVTGSLLTMHVLIFETADVAERRTLATEIEASARISSGSIGIRNTYWAYERWLYLEGRWDELRALSSEHEPPVLNVFQNSAYAVRALLDWHQGRFDQARQLIAGMLPDADDLRTRDQMLFVPREPSRIAAQMALEDGELERARELLIEQDNWIEQSGAIIGRAESRLLWAQLHQIEGDNVLAEQAAQEALRLAQEPEQPLALIAIYRFLGILALRGGDDASALAYLEQSQELADTAELPFERARTMLVSAEACLDTGRIEEARGKLNTVRRMGSKLGAQLMLEHAGQLAARIGVPGKDSRFGLTTREMDVLRCLSEGMSDKQIANELFISPNTVMRHVASIRGKLDVDSRMAAVIVATREEMI